MVIKYKHSLYQRSDIVCSCPGSDEIPSYVLDYKPDGGVCLKQKGTTPLYKMIQANKANCDLSSVLEQCVHQNQLAITSQADVESAIADFTSFKSYADIFTGIKQLGQVWNEMPLEVREKFNSSKSSFVGAIADADFSTRLSDGYNDYYKAVRKRLDNSCKPSIMPTPDSTPAQPVPDDSGAPAIKSPSLTPTSSESNNN